MLHPTRGFNDRGRETNGEIGYREEHRRNHLISAPASDNNLFQEIAALLDQLYVEILKDLQKFNENDIMEMRDDDDDDNA